MTNIDEMKSWKINVHRGNLGIIFSPPLTCISQTTWERLKNNIDRKFKIEEKLIAIYQHIKNEDWRGYNGHKTCICKNVDHRHEHSQQLCQLANYENIILCRQCISCKCLNQDNEILNDIVHDEHDEHDKV